MDMVQQMGLRRSGRTLEMVRSIGPEGGVVIVTTVAMREYVRRMINDIIPESVAKNVHIMIVRNRSDLHMLQGLRSRVYFDHACFETSDAHQRLAMQEAASVAAWMNRREEDRARVPAPTCPRIRAPRTVPDGVQE